MSCHHFLDSAAAVVLFTLDWKHSWVYIIWLSCYAFKDSDSLALGRNYGPVNGLDSFATWLLWHCLVKYKVPLCNSQILLVILDFYLRLTLLLSLWSKIKLNLCLYDRLFIDERVIWCRHLWMVHQFKYTQRHITYGTMISILLVHEMQVSVIKQLLRIQTTVFEGYLCQQHLVALPKHKFPEQHQLFASEVDIYNNISNM